MPTININQIKMYYELAGKGQPIVFISGLGLDHSTWLPITPYFSNDYQVLIFDNRGVGQTDTPNEPYSIAMMAEDAIQLMNGLGIEKAHIIGHSMGGAIAQYMAIHYPDKIDRLVLYASAAKMPMRSTIPFDTNGKLWEKNVDLKLLTRNILPWLFSEEFLANTDLEKLVDDILAYPHPQILQGFKNQSLACQALDLRSEIYQINTQTLVLAGEDDIALPVEQSTYLSDKIPAAILRILPKMAHVFHLEHPKLFSEVIKNFLSIA